MKYCINPDLKFEGNIEEFLNKDSHYSSVVIGSDNYFALLAKHVKLEENEIVAGASIDENSNLINIFIKSKTPKISAIVVDQNIKIE